MHGSGGDDFVFGNAGDAATFNWFSRRLIGGAGEDVIIDIDGGQVMVTILFSIIRTYLRVILMQARQMIFL